MIERLPSPLEHYNPDLGPEQAEYKLLWVERQREFPQFGPDRGFLLLEFDFDHWRVTRWMSLN